MSSRALRKLQQQQELEAAKARAKLQKDEGTDEEDDGDADQNDISALVTGSNLGARAKMPPHRNPFDLVSNERLCPIYRSMGLNC